MSATGYNEAEQYLTTDNSTVTSALPISAPSFIGPMVPSGNITFPGDVTVQGTLTAETITYLDQNVIVSDHVEINSTSNSIPALKVTSSGTADIFQAVDGDTSEIFKLTSTGDVNVNAQFTIDGTTGNTFTNGTLGVDGLLSSQGGITNSGPISSTGNINAIASITYNSSTATTGSVLDLSVAQTSLITPKGTTAQRPTGVKGMIRYNSDSDAFEGYSGASPAWGAIGGAASGPTYTTDTKSYTSYGLYQAPGQQISASSITGTPSYMQVMCMTENFLLMSDGSSSSYMWLFINTAGTWSFAARYATTYVVNQAKCVGNQIVLLTTDSSANYSCQEWLYSAGAVSFVRTIASGNVNAAGLGMIANYVSFFDITNSTVRLYKFDGVSTWTGVTNQNFSAGFSIGNNDSTCLCSNPLQLITSDASAGTNATHRFYTITAGSPGSVNTSAVQTITLTANTPSGFSNYAYSQPTVDLTNVSYSYIHFTASQSALGGTNVGGMVSYQYTGGSWTFRNSFTLGQASSDYAGGGLLVCLYYGSGLGMSVWNDTLTVGTYTNKLLQFNLVKTAGAPYITCTLGSNFFPSGAQFNGYMPLVEAVTGNYVAVFSNNGATPEYINIFGPRTSNSTTNVDYENTSDNVECSGNLYCNGAFIRMPVTSAGTIQSLTPALMDGLFFIDSTTGVMRYLFNGSWQTLSFGSSTGGSIGGTGYVANSGNLGLTGALINASQLNSGAVNSVGTTQILMPNQPYDVVVVRFDGQLSGSASILSQTNNLCSGGYSVAWVKNGTGDYNLNFTAVSGHVSSISKVVCAGSSLVWGSSSAFIFAKQNTTADLQIGCLDTSSGSVDTSGVLTCYVIRT